MYIYIYIYIQKIVQVKVLVAINSEKLQINVLFIMFNFALLI